MVFQSIRTKWMPFIASLYKHSNLFVFISKKICKNNTLNNISCFHNRQLTRTISNISSKQTPLSFSLSAKHQAVPFIGDSTIMTEHHVLPKKKTVYKRKLPVSGVAFSSDTGKLLFREALLAGTMEVVLFCRLKVDTYFKRQTFFTLAEQFRTQDHPAYCGLTTLTMVLNAFQIDPYRTWKGIWRWYHETMLDCCVPLHYVREHGLTFSQFVCLAECNGCSFDTIAYVDCNVTENDSRVLRPEDINSNMLKSEIQKFRAIVKNTCSQSNIHKHLIVSYERRALQQTSSGHFSPIGGYHEDKDLVLIMDVARFKYPPHWVSIPDLVKAMSIIDPVTTKPRGYAVIKKTLGPDYGKLTLFKIEYPPKTEAVYIFPRFLTYLEQQLKTIGFSANVDNEAKMNTIQSHTVTSHPLEFLKTIFREFLKAVTEVESMRTLISTAKTTIVPESINSHQAHLHLTELTLQNDISNFDASQNLFTQDREDALKVVKFLLINGLIILECYQMIQQLESTHWFPTLSNVFMEEMKYGTFSNIEVDGFGFRGDLWETTYCMHNTTIVTVKHLFIVLFLALLPLYRTILTDTGWQALHLAIQDSRIVNMFGDSEISNQYTNECCATFSKPCCSNSTQSIDVVCAILRFREVISKLPIPCHTVHDDVYETSDCKNFLIQ